MPALLHFGGKAMYKGIDVSDNQGKIDWDAVAAAGCSFAVLRSVRRSGKVDYQFEANFEGCLANSIPVSVYKYTYATTEAAASEEAKQVVELLEKHGLRCIVWWDVEDRENLCGLGSSKLTACIQAAREVIGTAARRSFTGRRPSTMTEVCCIPPPVFCRTEGPPSWDTGTPCTWR